MILHSQMCLFQTAFQNKVVLENIKRGLYRSFITPYCYDGQKDRYSRNFRANNKASTGSFFICRGHCTHKAHTLIESFTASLKSSKPLPATTRTIIVSFAITSLVAYLLWELHARRERNVSTVKHKFAGIRFL